MRQRLKLFSDGSCLVAAAPLTLVHLYDEIVCPVAAAPLPFKLTDEVGKVIAAFAPAFAIGAATTEVPLVLVSIHS